MKKFLLIFVLCILTAGVLSAQQLELKEVITRSARGIEGELPQKAKVALLNFESPTKAFSDYVLDELTSELLETGKVTVVDRKNITAILNEMKFQYSGYVSDESMVSIGKMIGAQYIISGTLTDMKTHYRFRIRIINVETAAIQRQITSELKNDKEVAYLMGGDSAVRELERQENSKPTSNVRNNWFSAELSGGYNLSQGGVLSVGARYERMFFSKISAGANFFWVIPFEQTVTVGPYELKDFDRGNIYGIDAFLRCYPWGRKFFIGLGFGYFEGGNAVPSSISEYGHGPEYQSRHSAGIAITGELGFKIDVGKEGGFFVEPGFLGSLIIGTVREGVPIDGYFRGYLGIGYAF